MARPAWLSASRKKADSPAGRTRRKHPPDRSPPSSGSGFILAPLFIQPPHLSDMAGQSDCLRDRSTIEMKPNSPIDHLGRHTVPPAAAHTALLQSAQSARRSRPCATLARAAPCILHSRPHRHPPTPRPSEAPIAMPVWDMSFKAVNLESTAL